MAKKKENIGQKLAEGFADLEAKNIAYESKLEAFNVEVEEFEQRKVKENLRLDAQRKALAEEIDDAKYENSKLEAKKNQIASDCPFWLILPSMNILLGHVPISHMHRESSKYS